MRRSGGRMQRRVARAMQKKATGYEKDWAA